MFVRGISKMKRKIVMGCILGVIAVGGAAVGAVAYKQYNNYELKQDTVTIELGEELPEEQDYYVSSNENAVKNTTLDFSAVDLKKAGSYEAAACYKDKIFPFTVVVQDTTKPTVKLANDGKFELIEGGSLSGKEIVADAADLSGIASIVFSDNVTVDKEKKDMLEAVSLTYDKEGDYTNTCTVTDENGNDATANISVHVKADYKNHISGFQDWVIEAGSTGIDFLSGITPDDRILSVEPDMETVDLTAPGEYQLAYNITGDDEESVLQEQVKVTVLDAATAQEKANAGETVLVSNNEKKEKYVAPPKQKSSNGSGTSGSSGQQASGAAGTSENTPSSIYDIIKPGQTYDIGEPIVSGKVLNGGTSYGYREVYIDPNTGEQIFIEE